MFSAGFKLPDIEFRISGWIKFPVVKDAKFRVPTAVRFPVPRDFNFLVSIKVILLPAMGSVFSAQGHLAAGISGKIALLPASMIIKFLMLQDTLFAGSKEVDFPVSKDVKVLVLKGVMSRLEWFLSVVKEVGCPVSKVAPFEIPTVVRR